MDARPSCGFAGQAHIEPADAEIASPQQFTLEGVSELPAGCVQWWVRPDAFYTHFANHDPEPVKLDPETGELSVWSLPEDVTLEVGARVDGVDVATTSVRYFDPSKVLDGMFREVGVLSCPDYVESPREQVGEIFLAQELSVTFAPFETYVDYWGACAWSQAPDDPRSGTIECEVDSGNYLPESMDLQGTYVARTDGYLELRDVWLGPDDARCGHVLERVR